MFQTLKNARRRTVETVLETVGAAEKTIDNEFEVYSENFYDMMEDMNECGAAVTAVLLNQKTFIKDAVELTKCLNRIYVKNNNPEHWPGVENHLQYTEAAARYEAALTLIDEAYRSSSAKVSGEIALTPLRSAVTAMGPSVENIIKERGELVKDYDSYQRRLKVSQEKKRQAQGKPSEAEATAEVTKNEGKVQKSKELYEASNDKCKREIESSRRAHDTLIDTQLLTLLVCQARLFSLASQRLEEIITLLPKQKVDQVKDRVDQYIRQGGAKAQVEEKSTLSVGFDVLMGKAYVSDLKKPTEEELAEEEKKKQEDLERAAAIVKEDENKKKNSVATPIPPQNRPAPPPAPSSYAKSNPSPPSVPSAPSSAPPVPSSGPKWKTPSTTPSAPPAPPSAPSAPPPVPQSAPRGPPPPPIIPKAPPKPKEQLVVALYDHEIDTSDELPFRRGEKIIVLDSSDAGWWKGKHSVTGAIGIFPVNYVKPDDT
mmetsp:Transcript_9933/g.10433  ORF Transcript_9933/g.10433 Transcript_9933/m.10433 type:complete len:485 (-) Transcript_9933:50-1504(-)|eukprot:CAMPEP_0174823246 /NCGR_PEP_ID=MMETSP1107-20130205/22848_1 /TAXON_ID=36770 /ORGANISM="Paraphysomonas vestita, Strain GFlagA" /LENGTH=484 /DNA_ID=CAMNT_0016045087 /DNA_START=31 /DNA_END=1485 /DNA_ORIENTATION=-